MPGPTRGYAILAHLQLQQAGITAIDRLLHACAQRSWDEGELLFLPHLAQRGQHAGRHFVSQGHVWVVALASGHRMWPATAAWVLMGKDELKPAQTGIAIARIT